MTKDQKEELKKSIDEVVEKLVGFDDNYNCISYNNILDRAHGCLNRVNQWARMSSFDAAAKYYNQAESLIELVEIDVCGSVGGFDKGQENYSVASQIDNIDDALYSRYHWLMNHYYI